MMLRSPLARISAGTLEWGLCLFLSGVLVLAAGPKLAAPAAFALAVRQYGILPDALVNLVAIYLPWLEMSCAAALLIIPQARRVTLGLVAGLLLAFTLAMAIALGRGISIPCGCFGGDSPEHPLGVLNLMRNIGLAAAAIAAIVLRRARVGPGARKFAP